MRKRVYRIFTVQVAGFLASTGVYLLTFGLPRPAPGDDIGDGPAGARPILLSGDSTTLAGTLGTVGDVDVFAFFAAAAGFVTARLDAVPGSGLDSVLTVLDAAQIPIARDDNSGFALGSLVQFAVTGGQTYYLQAAAVGEFLGSYLLSVQLRGHDDAGDSFDAARAVHLDRAGFAGHVGVINIPGDVDTFRFVAPVSGGMTIEQTAFRGSTLDSHLFVFDADRALITSSDDAGGARDSRVHFTVVAGRTYFLQATGSGGSTGAYHLAFTPVRDDVADDVADARAIALGAGNTGDQVGRIEVPDDVDLFRFVATATGRVSVGQAAVAGDPEPLDSFLVAYDAAGTQIARNDDAGARTKDSLVTFDVKQGATYLVRAGGYGLSTGLYRLTIAPGPPLADDSGDTFDQARLLRLSDTGSGDQVGAIEQAGDVDVLRFVAPVTGRLTIRLDPAPQGPPGVVLRVHTPIAGELTQVASDDRLRGTVTLDVTRGQTLLLQVAFPGATTGRYRLEFRTDATVGPLVRKLVDPRVGADLTDESRQSFTRLVTLAGIGQAALEATAEAIGDVLVQEFIASQRAASPGGQLPTSYLLLWFDPVDFILTDPQGRQVGFTEHQGRVNENLETFFARPGNGALQVLVLPEALADRYQLELVGVGADQALVGGRLILQEGLALKPTRIIIDDRTVAHLPVQSPKKEGLVAVLDFSRPSEVVQPSPGPAAIRSGQLEPPDPVTGLPSQLGPFDPVIGPPSRTGSPGPVTNAPGRSASSGPVAALTDQVQGILSLLVTPLITRIRNIGGPEPTTTASDPASDSLATRPTQAAGGAATSASLSTSPAGSPSPDSPPASEPGADGTGAGSPGVQEVLKLMGLVANWVRAFWSRFPGLTTVLESLRVLFQPGSGEPASDSIPSDTPPASGPAGNASQRGVLDPSRLSLPWLLEEGDRLAAPGADAPERLGPDEDREPVAVVSGSLAVALLAISAFPIPVSGGRDAARLPCPRTAPSAKNRRRGRDDRTGRGHAPLTEIGITS